MEYRQVPSFPDYAVSDEGKVRHLIHGWSPKIIRISKTGGHMIVVTKEAKKYVRAIEALQLEAFGEELGVK